MKMREEGKTDIIVFPSQTEMCRKAADEIIDDLRKNPQQLLCIAAGHTSLGLFRELVRRFQAGEIDFSKAGFVAMDEWAGMDAATEGSCGWLLETEFLSKVDYPKERVFLWDGKARDQAGECERAADFVRKNSRYGVIDYLVLGVGMNGHLALNEPGTGLDERAHVAVLDAITADVGQKYFKKATALGAGLTLGLADFREARRSVLMISGEKKKDICRKIWDASCFHAGLPATAVYEFGNASIYCDRAAADD